MIYLLILTLILSSCTELISKENYPYTTVFYKQLFDQNVSDIYINDTILIDRKISLPKGKTLHFQTGGIIIFNGNDSVFFYSKIIADNYQPIFIFKKSPKIFLIPKDNNIISVCWFGATINDGKDDSQAANYASDWSDMYNKHNRYKGAIIKYPAGYYNHFGTVKIWDYTTVKGDGVNNTYIIGAKYNENINSEKSPRNHIATYERIPVFRIGDWDRGVKNVSFYDINIKCFFGKNHQAVSFMADIDYAHKNEHHENITIQRVNVDSVLMICTFLRAGGKEKPDNITWHRFKNIRIADCVISNTENKAIEIQEGEKIYIYNNTIINAQDGIQLIHSCKDAIISNNIVDYEDTGIAISNGGENIIVSNNYVKWTGLGLDYPREPGGYAGALHMKWDNAFINGDNIAEPVKNVIISNNIFDSSESSHNYSASVCFRWGDNWVNGNVQDVKITNNIFKTNNNNFHYISPHDIKPSLKINWNNVEWINNSFYGGIVKDNMDVNGQTRFISNFIENSVIITSLSNIILKDNIINKHINVSNTSNKGVVMINNIENNQVSYLDKLEIEINVNKIEQMGTNN